MTSEIARYIDHTLLAPQAATTDVVKICREAKEHGFYAVCINPTHVPKAHKELSGSGVQVATVVGFPLGATFTEIKVQETRRAIEAGADEIDMVINVGALKSGDVEFVTEEIGEVVKAAGDHPVKVIIECDLLTEQEKIAATRACVKAGAFMVKTSTGFVKDGRGATVEDVALLKKTIGPDKLGIKASAGVRNHSQAQALIDAGATRLGTSAGVSIVKGVEAGASY